MKQARIYSNLFKRRRVDDELLKRKKLANMLFSVSLSFFSTIFLCVMKKLTLIKFFLIATLYITKFSGFVIELPPPPIPPEIIPVIRNDGDVQD